MPDTEDERRAVALDDYRTFDCADDAQDEGHDHFSEPGEFDLQALRNSGAL